ncbi:acyloxyacyl hydrolase [Pelagibacteraceae bacterium]|nr:acyloxyacyl hydrolase [Pelagibacteraceae bacterium]
MKFIAAVLISTFFMANNYALSGPLDKLERRLDKLFGKEIESGADIRAAKKREKVIQRTSKQSISQPCNNKRGFADKFEASLDKLFGQEISTMADAKCSPRIKRVKRNTNLNKRLSYKNDNPQNISFYAGTFDSADEKGIGETQDDKTSLFGIEHKNKDLFRDTWIGKFSPTTGAFVTGENSIYLYSGIEADYNLGPINISPSFAPGYYEAGNGKNLGSALEFKSQVKIGVDLFKNTNLGYRYSHISNNDWGDVNPGTDNQSINLSKKF